VTQSSTTIDGFEVGPRVLLERLDDPEALVLTLNREAERNPLDMGTLLELQGHLEQARQDQRLRAIIITGAGPGFSAGGDLKAYARLYDEPADFADFLGTFGQVCTLLEECPAITIAMVNGACVAGGLELALSCDLITMSERARIGDGHVQFAQLPGAGGSQRLVRAIGVQRAKNWLITGRLVSAAEALEAGLVALVTPPELLRDGTLELARSLERTSALTLERMKQLIRVATNTALDQGLAREREIVFEYATQSADAREGLQAFAERRPPTYLGR
jgi:enoyl-CoA hydratase/carnithine racemase